MDVKKKINNFIIKTYNIYSEKLKTSSYSTYKLYYLLYVSSNEHFFLRFSLFCNVVLLLKRNFVVKRSNRHSIVKRTFGIEV